MLIFVKTRDKNKLPLAIFVVSLFAACSGSQGPAGISLVTSQAPLSECLNGGIIVDTSNDTNGSQAVAVCNGLNGVSIVMDSVNLNGNDTSGVSTGDCVGLYPSTESNVSSAITDGVAVAICNGTQGSPGPAGSPGVSGANSNDGASITLMPISSRSCTSVASQDLSTDTDCSEAVALCNGTDGSTPSLTFSEIYTTKNNNLGEPICSGNTAGACQEFITVGSS